MNRLYPDGNELYTDRNGDPQRFVPFFGDEQPALPVAEVDSATEAVSAEVPSRLDRRKLFAALAAGTAVLTSVFALVIYEGTQGDHIAEVEDCVEDRVGYPVTLTTHPQHEHIMQPPALAEDIEACL